VRIRLVLAFIALMLTMVAVAPGASHQANSDNMPKPNQSSPPAGDAGVRPRIVTEADNDKQVAVAKGSLLVVRLAANPTTGYSWQLGGDPAPLALESTKFQSNNGDKKLVGSPQVQVMQFKPGNPGTASLILEYRRPWEKNIAAAKTFKVQVTVQ
jgi:inhibitor of cysteine peptidase